MSVTCVLNVGEQNISLAMPVAPTTPTPEIQPHPILDSLWKVVLLNDDVNLMPYVMHALVKVFSMSKEKAQQHMKEAHDTGRSIVWIGAKERAEHYVLMLNQWHLGAELEHDT
jgi:ATP-dependent Clp protease adaptor protein ClpS